MYFVSQNECKIPWYPRSVGQSGRSQRFNDDLETIRIAASKPFDVRHPHEGCLRAQPAAHRNGLVYTPQPNVGRDKHPVCTQPFPILSKGAK
jgi:hypothetical protein